MRLTRVDRKIQPLGVLIDGEPVCACSWCGLAGEAKGLSVVGMRAHDFKVQREPDEISDVSSAVSPLELAAVT